MEKEFKNFDEQFRTQTWLWQMPQKEKRGIHEHNRFSHASPRVRVLSWIFLAFHRPQEAG
jgi:hypothetical protein